MLISADRFAVRRLRRRETSPKVLVGSYRAISRSSFVASGPLLETQDHIDAARERGYLRDEQHVEILRLAHRALGASTNFIVYLDKAAIEWRKEGRRRPKRGQHGEPSTSHSPLNLFLNSAF